jgi:hypothetical protein
VIGFGAFDCALLVNTTAAQTPNVEIRIRDVFMVTLPLIPGP